MSTTRKGLSALSILFMLVFLAALALYVLGSDKTGAIVAMTVAGILMTGAAVLATPQYKRRTRPGVAAPVTATDSPMPRITGVYWLKRNAKTDRLLAWVQIGVYIVAALLIASTVALFNLMQMAKMETPRPEDLASIEDGKHMLTLMLIIAAGLPLLARLGLRSMKHSLGTDGTRLYVRTDEARQQSFAPEQLVYGNRAILFREQVFATQTGKRQPLYADGEIETYIAPLLGRAKRLGPIALLGYQLEHRESTLMANLIFAVIVASFVFGTGLWHHFQRTSDHVVMPAKAGIQRIEMTGSRPSPE